MVMGRLVGTTRAEQLFGEKLEVAIRLGQSDRNSRPCGSCTDWLAGTHFEVTRLLAIPKLGVGLDDNGKAAGKMQYHIVNVDASPASSQVILQQLRKLK